MIYQTQQNYDLNCINLNYILYTDTDAYMGHQKLNMPHARGIFTKNIGVIVFLSA